MRTEITNYKVELCNVSTVAGPFRIHDWLAIAGLWERARTRFHESAAHNLFITKSTSRKVLPVKSVWDFDVERLNSPAEDKKAHLHSQSRELQPCGEHRHAISSDVVTLFVFIIGARLFVGEQVRRYVG